MPEQLLALADEVIDEVRDVRFWHKADMAIALHDVWFGEDGLHLPGVRRRLAAFSRSVCWTAHLSISEFTRICSSSLSFGDLGRGAGADLNSLLKFNPRKKSLSPSMIVKSSRACSRKRFVSSSFVSFG
jgi:hypothetical protein